MKFFGVKRICCVYPIVLLLIYEPVLFGASKIIYMQLMQLCESSSDGMFEVCKPMVNVLVDHM